MVLEEKEGREGARGGRERGKAEEEAKRKGGSENISAQRHISGIQYTVHRSDGEN